MLMEALDALNERDRRIIAMRFGLPSGREYTQKEVADAMGISQSYISRLEKRIIGRLRRDLLRRMEGEVYNMSPGMLPHSRGRLFFLWISH